MKQTIIKYDKALLETMINCKNCDHPYCCNNGAEIYRTDIYRIIPFMDEIIKQLPFKNQQKINTAIKNTERLQEVQGWSKSDILTKALTDGRTDNHLLLVKALQKYSFDKMCIFCTNSKGKEGYERCALYGHTPNILPEFCRYFIIEFENGQIQMDSGYKANGCYWTKSEDSKKEGVPIVLYPKFKHAIIDYYGDEVYTQILDDFWQLNNQAI